MSKTVLFHLEEGNFTVVTETHMITNMTAEEKNGYIQNPPADICEICEPEDGKVIELKHIAEISADQDDSVVEIKFQINGTSASEAVHMKNQGERDRFVKVVYGMLEHDFDYSTQRESVFKAALTPLVAMALVLIAGGILTWLTQLAHEPVQKSLLAHRYAKWIYSLLSSISPDVPLMITGIVLGMCTIYLFVQVKNPPMIVVITPKK